MDQHWQMKPASKHIPVKSPRPTGEAVTRDGDGFVFVG